jgi:TPR repeat protein
MSEIGGKQTFHHIPRSSQKHGRAMSLKHDEYLAGQAMESGAYEDALRLLAPLARRNSEYALLSLGWIYEMGATGAPDADAARSYYAHAAAQGSAAGCFGLGRLLLGQAEEAKARAAFRTGAERGDLSSMAELGRMLLEGRGGPSNAAEGWGWLEKAAEQGQIFAQRTLLAIEDHNARTIMRKLSVKLKIFRLALKGARLMLNDRYSDKVR